MYSLHKKPPNKWCHVSAMNTMMYPLMQQSSRALESQFVKELMLSSSFRPAMAGGNNNSNFFFLIREIAALIQTVCLVFPLAKVTREALRKQEEKTQHPPNISAQFSIESKYLELR